MTTIHRISRAKGREISVHCWPDWDDPITQGALTATTDIDLVTCPDCIRMGREHDADLASAEALVKRLVRGMALVP